MSLNSAFEVSAYIGLLQEPVLSCQARTSDCADFVWAHNGHQFTVSFTGESLREFVRQGTLALEAMERLAVQEQNGHDAGEFSVREGEDGRLVPMGRS